MKKLLLLSIVLLVSLGMNTTLALANPTFTNESIITQSFPSAGQSQWNISMYQSTGDLNDWQWMNFEINNTGSYVNTTAVYQVVPCSNTTSWGGATGDMVGADFGNQNTTDNSTLVKDGKYSIKAHYDADDNANIYGAVARYSFPIDTQEMFYAWFYIDDSTNLDNSYFYSANLLVRFAGSTSYDHYINVTNGWNFIEVNTSANTDAFDDGTVTIRFEMRNATPSADFYVYIDSMMTTVKAETNILLYPIPASSGNYFSWTDQLTQNGTMCARWWVNETGGYEVMDDLDCFTITGSNLLNVTVYDEETVALLSEWDIYIDNSTHSETQTNASSYTGQWSGTDVEVRISKSDYATRSIYVQDLNTYQGLNMTVYILNSTNGNYIRFHTYDASDTPLPYIYITANKFINSTWQMVERQYTDSSGIVTFFLDPTVTYNLQTYNENCTNQSVSIKPVVEDYSFDIVCGADLNYTIPYYWTSLINMSIDYNKTMALCNASNVTLWYNISDGSALLSDYGVNFTVNGTTLWDDSGSTATGEVFTTNLNLSQYAGYTGFAMYNYSRTGYPDFALNKSYTIWYYQCYNQGQMNTSIMSIKNRIDDGTYGLSSFFILMVAIFCGIAGSGFGSAIRGVGTTGSVAIFMSIFTIFQLTFEMLTWTQYGFIFLIGIAVAGVSARW